MTALYCILCFAGGFLFGVFATALAVFSGDKREREYGKVKEDYHKFMKDFDVMKEANGRLLEEVAKKPLLLVPHDVVPKDMNIDEFCKWWSEEGYKLVEIRMRDEQTGRYSNE